MELFACTKDLDLRIIKQSRKQHHSSASSLNLQALSTMSDYPASHSLTLDPYKHLQILHNPDGSITRLREDPYTSPSSDPNLPISVLTKDITISQTNNTSVRLYLPRKALDNAFSSGDKLPLILYFHGGGFVLFSAASAFIHDFCINMANHVGAIVASVEYRRAPEHRLPAAYDDAMEALHWIKTNKDDWLSQYTDCSNCYLMGSSAGANIAYHAGLRTAAEVDHLRPLKIQGLILVQPFFGGTKRTGSELRLSNDAVLPLCASDLMWELSLPIGANRDHEYCNPTTGDGPRVLDKVKQLGWRILVTGCGGDPLVDRQMEMVKLTEEKGIKVVGRFVTGDCHGVEVRDPSKQKQLLEVVKNFIGFSFSTKEST